MLQLDSFFAWVSVDERELTEYSVEYSEDYMSASCWIASEEGKSFVINWRDIVRTHDSMGRTSVDGVRCGLAKGINRKGYKKDIAQERDTAQQMGVATSSSTDRLLVFSKIDMTDDDLYLHSHMPRIFGEIRLEVSYVEKGPRQELELKPYKVENKIHERAKSLTQHHTKLGNSVETQKKPAHSVKVKGPLRVFIFKYRPLEVLKAMGIVPLEGEQLRVMAARTREIIDLTMDDGDDIMVPATDDERERTVSHDAQEIVRESQVVSKQQSPIKEGKLPKWKLEETKNFSLFERQEHKVKPEKKPDMKDWSTKLRSGETDKQEGVEGVEDIFELDSGMQYLEGMVIRRKKENFWRSEEDRREDGSGGSSRNHVLDHDE